MTAIESFVTHRADESTVRGLPPGPKLPKLLQSVLYLTAGHYVVPRWRRRYGDVFAVHIAPAGHAVVLTRPEHIREVFAGPADVFHAGEGNAILGPIMGEHSVLLLDEDAHKASRKKVMAAFRGESIKSWGAVVEQVAADDIEVWPVGKPFAVHQHLNDISLEVILRVVFGLTDDARLAEMSPLLQRLIRIGPTIFIGWMYPVLDKVGPWRAFVQLKAHVDDLIYAEINDRREVPDLADRTDVLSKLLVADPSQTDAELRDHLVTLLLAGHETTASTLAWTFHDLARNPEVLARVQRAADEDDEAYLEATVKESMRLRPVIANVARRLTKPVTVAGYDLPAGVVVFPSIELVHHREDVWDAPKQFRPERFLGHNPPPATWIPFGGGLRRCLGASLATVEAVAVLKTVLKAVDITPVGAPEVSKKRNVTTVPARGARIVSSPR
ncbi:MAG: cytochrome P450 [Jatrophihabitans sp.]